MDVQLKSLSKTISTWYLISYRLITMDATKQDPLSQDNNDVACSSRQAIDDDLAKYALLDAFHHEPSAPGLKNKERLRLRATRHSVFYKALFIGAACLLLFFVPLLEQKHSFTNSTNYLTRKEDSEATKNTFLWSSTALEFVLLIVLLLDIVLKGIAFFPFYEVSKSKKVPKSEKPSIVKWYIYHHRCFAPYRLLFYAYTFCWVVSIICIIGTFITQDTNWFITTRQLVRPIFLIVQVTMLKKALKAILKVSLRQLFVLALFALLFIVIFIFMMIGFGIFPRHHHLDHKHNSDNTVNDEGARYFNSSAEAYWNLIVYLSTSNSPDIATPAYEHHRLYYLYFSIFYFIGNILILNVIAAFYAINFNSFMDESMERTWKHQKSSLRWAFKNMEKTEKGHVDTDKFKKILTNLNITDDEHMNLKSNAEYRDFENLIIEIFYKKPSGQGTRVNSSTEQAKCKARSMNVFRKCFSFFTNLLSFLVAVLQFFGLTVLVIEDYKDSLTDPNSIMAWTMMGFSIVLGIEIISRLVLAIMKHVIKYNREYSTAKQNKNENNHCKKLLNWFFCGHSLGGRKQLIKFLLLTFDWLLLIAVFSLGLVHLPCLKKKECLDSMNLITLIQITICCIALRMLRMLAKIPIFSFVFKNLIRILFLFIPFLLLGYLFYYEFAIIGMTLFHGVNLNDTEAAIICGSYENLEYHPYNFEDFGSTLVLLWNLMVGNNWHVMVDVYVRQKSIYSRIYFVIWWLVSETIIDGIIFGLLMEILTNAKGGLENVIEKSIKTIGKTNSWKDKLSLFLGFYVFSGEKGRLLSEAMGYSFSDIVKIVCCKIQPKFNKAADSPKPGDTSINSDQSSQTKANTEQGSAGQGNTEKSSAGQDNTEQVDTGQGDVGQGSAGQVDAGQGDAGQDNTEQVDAGHGSAGQGDAEQVEIESYEISYNDSGDENEVSQSTQEIEDEELPDNFEDLSWNIFDILEYIKNERTNKTKGKKRKKR